MNKYFNTENISYTKCLWKTKHVFGELLIFSEYIFKLLKCYIVHYFNNDFMISLTYLGKTLFSILRM